MQPAVVEIDPALKLQIEANRQAAIQKLQQLKNKKQPEKQPLQKAGPCLQEVHHPTFKAFSFVQGAKNLAEGLKLYDNVFSEAELSSITEAALAARESGIVGALKGESIVRSKARDMLLFGYHYQYFDTAVLKKGIWNGISVEPVPDWLHTVIDRFISQHIIPEAYRPDSVIINFYPRGGAIPPHRDHNDFYRPILSLRLQSPSKLSFGGSTTSKGTIGIQFKVPLSVGTVLSMDGFSGFGITHSVEPSDLLNPSISITFRKVKQKTRPLPIPVPMEIDAQNGQKRKATKEITDYFRTEKKPRLEEARPIDVDVSDQ